MVVWYEHLTRRRFDHARGVVYALGPSDPSFLSQSLEKKRKRETATYCTSGCAVVTKRGKNSPDATVLVHLDSLRRIGGTRCCSIRRCCEEVDPSAAGPPHHNEVHALRSTGTTYKLRCHQSVIKAAGKGKM